MKLKAKLIHESYSYLYSEIHSTALKFTNLKFKEKAGKLILAGNCSSRILEVLRRRTIAHSNGIGEEMLKTLLRS